MPLSDIDLYGVLISPLVPIMLAALLIVVVVRRVMILVRVVPPVWHPALFDVSLFLIALCGIVLAIGGRVRV